MKDEEYDEHCFRPRASAAKDEDDPIWCADCEYHRDHKIHAGSPSPMREQTPPPSASIMFTTQLARVRAYYADDVDPFVAALSARCTALEAENKRLSEQEAHIRGQLWLNHQCRGQYGDDGEMQCNAQHRNGEAHYIGPMDFKREDLPRLTSAICSMLRFEAMRCTALEHERDRWRDQMMNATVALGREGGSHYDDVPKHIRDLRSRCQHLEQAVRDYAKHKPSCVDYGSMHWRPTDEEACCTCGLVAALASLLPSQDETSDAERATFSAGYSQAIDDATRSRP